MSSEANGNEEQTISGCLAAGVYLFWFRLFCSSPIDDTPTLFFSIAHPVSLLLKNVLFFKKKKKKPVIKKANSSKKIYFFLYLFILHYTVIIFCYYKYSSRDL